MTTMSRQMELAKYLADCEASGRLTEKVFQEIIPVPSSRQEESDSRPLTLFGSNTDKIRIVAVVLATGPSIEGGFDLAFKYVFLSLALILSNYYIPYVSFHIFIK